MAKVKGETLPHRVKRRIVAGWFSRTAWVKHMPQWESVAWDGRGRSLQVCQGDRQCTATRIAGERSAGL